MEADVLSFNNITKYYPGVIANNHVCLNVRKGEIHTLVGENGAGKSTLIKCLSGAITPDEGEIVFDGVSYSGFTPKLSKDLGIAIIYQEMNLVNSLSVAENIFLGEKLGKLMNRVQVEKRAAQILDRLGVGLDPGAKVATLSTAQQQLVEISKALSRDIKLLVLDEPTAPLTSEEITKLFEIIDYLKKEGITIIYISHRMDEIFQISDRITVLRDGEVIDTLNAADTNRQKIIELMVGRTLSETFPEKKAGSSEPMLEVENLSGNGVRDINLHVNKGEIVGIGGLLGAGRTETVRLIYGADPKETGTIRIDGREVRIRSPKDAIMNGIGLVPEDRKSQGVFWGFSIEWNITIANIRNLLSSGMINNTRIREEAERFIKALRISTPSRRQLVGKLSGGNQQKVVLAKTLENRSRLIILDEPTRGIDVGAKHEIYKLMAELAEQGNSIVLISSDMEELLGMSDRIYVMAEGTIVGELSREEASQVRIMQLISDNSSSL